MPGPTEHVIVHPCSLDAGAFLTTWSIKDSVDSPPRKPHSPRKMSSILIASRWNSPTFKSFEERVETTVTSLKTKVGGTNHSGGSFEEVLNSTAHASAQSSAGGPRRAEEELQC
ncbi:Tumor protein D53 [Tupaia chinensis]|uniref:Tumor protein D53 n=1 Tax=Tupaia chinensis TaxID=246437 RepID=L9L4D9_TUPCH|nr:Tumor protein D53 [Tupaia chinensis]